MADERPVESGSEVRTGPSRGKRWLFGLATLILILACLEIIFWAYHLLVPGDRPDLAGIRAKMARVAASPAYDRTAKHQAAQDILHPYLGYVMNYPQRMNLKGAPPWGFPGEVAPVREPRENEFVIAVFGGSLAVQWAMNPSGMLTELARVERFKGRRIIVLPLGLGGYKQPQQLQAFAYFLAAGGHFDLVINLDGYNEIVQPIKNLKTAQIHPLYPSFWANRIKRHNNRELEATEDVFELNAARWLRRKLAALGGSIGWLPSSVINIGWFELDLLAERLISSKRTDLAKGWDLGRDPTVVGPPLTSYDEEPVRAYVVNLWTRCSRLMADLARENNIPYLHVLQPNQYAPGAKPLEAEKRAGFWRPDEPFRAVVEAVYPRLAREGQLMARDGLAFINGAELFKAEKRLLYKDDCCHLNKLGDQLLGRAIGQRIIELTADPLSAAERIRESDVAD